MQTKKHWKNVIVVGIALAVAQVASPGTPQNAHAQEASAPAAEPAAAVGAGAVNIDELGYLPWVEPPSSEPAGVAATSLSDTEQAEIAASNAADEANTGVIGSMSEYADGLAARAAIIEAQRAAGTEVVP